MKKTIAIVLSALMIMCFMPTMAFATTTTTTTTTTTALAAENIQFVNTAETYTYTGDKIEPKIKVVVSGKELTPTTDYSVEYTNNINAGTDTGTITVKGAGIYSGTQTKTFTINKRNISEVNAAGIPAVATGNEAVPDDSVVLTYNGKTLAKITDYTFTTPNHSTAGLYYITVSGAGTNFTGTKQVPFNAGTSISGNDYTLTTTLTSYPPYIYDGTQKYFGSVTVKETSGPKTLTLNTDYIVRYSNNVNAGTMSALLTVEGIGNYSGTKEAKFTISQRNISNNVVSIANIENQAPNSRPTPDVTYGSTKLVAGTDFDYRWTESGTTGTVEIIGKGNYIGSSYKNYTVGSSIINANVVVAPYPNEYTGYGLTPAITVNSGALRNGIDYKLVYENNIAVGYGTVKIIGIGQYGGTITRFFPINQKDITGGRITVSPSSVAFNGKEQKPTISVYDGVRYLSATDYDVSYLNNTKIGKATVYVTGKGNYKGSLFATFDIVGNSIASTYISLSQTEYTYDGYAKQPTVTVKDGYTTLTNGVHYTLDYKDNVKAGTATVTITGKGDYSGSTTRTFSIRGLDQTLSTNYTRYTKYLSSDSFMLGARATGDGTGFSYTSSDNSVVQVSSFGTVTVVGTGVATITVSTVGNTKYTPVSKLVTVTVKPNRAVYRVTSPSEGKLKVQITKGTGVTKYQIRYGRNGNYRNSYYTYSDSFYSTQSRTFSNLNSGSKYYVKVRAYKTMPNGLKAWGNWGTIKAVRVK